MKLGWLCHCGTKKIYNLLQKQQILIQKTLDVLSLLRPIVHDTSKTAKITWFILVFHWGMDVIYDFYYIHGPISIPIMSTAEKSIVWNGRSSRPMSGAVLTVDFWRDYWPLARKTSSMTVVNEYILSTGVKLQCWFCPYLLHFIWRTWLLRL